MTAHYLTHSAHADLIQPGEWMLVHGTGGGTCQWAAQMAKLKGYKVIGTAAKGKGEIAKSTGVDELILLDEAPGTACVYLLEVREREHTARVAPCATIHSFFGNDRQEILIKL